MRAFLSGDYVAYFYKVGSETAGYALVRTSVTPKYLRQFFICREHRRKGYGTAFFRELLEALGERAIDIDVLYWNEAGIRFWESLGFQPRSIAMRYQKG
jgi:GNAT superfamily N-acetyltransferase